MWVLAASLFFIAKTCLIWRHRHTTLLNLDTLSFIFLWPGFDLVAWNRATLTSSTSLGARGLANLVGGAGLTWGLARCVADPFYATWVAMIGFVIAMHGGLFTLLAAYWRSRGRDVAPLMHCPAAATSVTEFWGKRWNTAFRDLAHGLIFKRLLHRGYTAPVAVFIVFLASGIVHELVITVPARGGYGGPTLYFILQPLCMWMERSCPFKKNGFVWRIRALVFLIAPLPLAFPAAFVERVMRPFFTFIQALP